MNNFEQISVVILNWKRSQNLKNKILPILVKCPIIGEIIISHGRSDTYFRADSKKKSVINRKDWNLNQKYGLSLRFICAGKATYNTIVFIDDDIIVHPATLINMYKIFKSNSPCIVGKFGRIINRDMTYNHRDYDNINNAPILLTSLLMVDKKLINLLFQHSYLILPFIQKNSSPLWNGEDIYLSIIAMIYYKKWGIVVDDNHFFPVTLLRTKHDLRVAISKTQNHINYRSNLIKQISSLYSIPSGRFFNEKNI